jgi:hypothetical protein
MSANTLILAARDHLSTLGSFFPLLVALASLLLFVGSANIAYLFLSIALVLVIPALVGAFNFLGGFLPATWPTWLTRIPATAGWLSEAAAAQAQPILSFPSYWMTATVFIITYILMNAADLYNQKPAEGAAATGTTARKSQAVIAMITTIIIGLILMYSRIFATRQPAESVLGLLLGVGLGIFAASAIYTFMVDCGGLRVTDLFGIANRLQPSGKDGSVCYPVAV